ncbi:MAG: AAA family ATPase [Pirellulales bacterium]|nr:AAA family ATPase [Pirellulales bacterium]
MPTTEARTGEDLWLQTFLSEERFCPTEPKTLDQTGLPLSVIESLVLKHLAIVGTASGRGIAESICLPFRILEEVFGVLRTRQLLVHSGAAAFNDYYYMLTDQGQQRAKAFQQACAYCGPAPVPFREYVIAVEAQCISTESPTDKELAEAFADISVDEQLFDMIGPAVNSGAGMFLYGHPGNGKSTLARSITLCFGQDIWIPRVILEDTQLVKLFDPSCHREVVEDNSGILKGQQYDRRWVRIRRPTVAVGGELTMDNLEIRHDPVSNVSEAPLQLKSNCGCLLIDDFGRQRIEPSELLNRWIVPLEAGYDFLTLATGKKLQVPFEQLIIFSTNLEPRELVDEAFLRRIPYKIELTDPSEEEFHRLFELYAGRLGCEYRRQVVAYVLDRYYRPAGRALRRCHPRDLLKQVKNYCKYKRIAFEMRPDYFDKVAVSYFAVVFGNE